MVVEHFSFVKENNLVDKLKLIKLCIEALFDVGKDFIHVSISFDLLGQAKLLEMLNDWHGSVDIGFKTLLQALDIIIGSTRAGSTPTQDPLQANFFAAVEKQDELQIDLKRWTEILFNKCH